MKMKSIRRTDWEITTPEATELSLKWENGTLKVSLAVRNRELENSRCGIVNTMPALSTQ